MRFAFRSAPPASSRACGACAFVGYALANAFQAATAPSPSPSSSRAAPFAKAASTTRCRTACQRG